MYIGRSAMEWGVGRAANEWDTLGREAKNASA